MRYSRMHAAKQMVAICALLLLPRQLQLTVNEFNDFNACFGIFVLKCTLLQ
jgi:hypothetical protein